jgi:L-2,4-diaminobutyrate transaminase
VRGHASLDTKLTSIELEPAMLNTTPPSDNELNAWDRDHFFHPSTHMGQHARGETLNRIVTGAEGVYIVDRQGRRSLDAFAGLYCVNVGYGRTKISDAIAAQAAALPYYHAYVSHGSEPSIRLAKMIIDRAPRGMSRVFFGLSGSDANETNIKLVWYINNVLGRRRRRSSRAGAAITARA